MKKDNAQPGMASELYSLNADEDLACTELCCCSCDFGDSLAIWNLTEIPICPTSHLFEFWAIWNRICFACNFLGNFESQLCNHRSADSVKSCPDTVEITRAKTATSIRRSERCCAYGAALCRKWIRYDPLPSPNQILLRTIRKQLEQMKRTRTSSELSHGFIPAATLFVMLQWRLYHTIKKSPEKSCTKTDDSIWKMKTR